MVQPCGYCFKASADRHQPLPERFHHRHRPQFALEMRALTLLRAGEATSRADASAANLNPQFTLILPSSQPAQLNRML
jgi:hypothetical protein